MSVDLLANLGTVILPVLLGIVVLVVNIRFASAAEPCAPVDLR